MAEHVPVWQLSPDRRTTRILCMVLLFAIVWPVFAGPRRRALCRHSYFPERCSVLPAAEPEDPVKKSIEAGVRYLRAAENGKGNFEYLAPVLAEVRPGGVTALAVVALLKSGVPADDPLIQRCLKYLRGLPPSQTYTVGLQTMAFCLAGHKEDRERVQKNLKWLTDNRTEQGWGYDADIKSPDHSLNFYALLGIREASRAGFNVDRKMLEELRRHYGANETGKWAYRRSQPSITMTSAGAVNLLTCAEILDGKATADEKKVIQASFQWLGAVFPADIEKTPFQHPFYGLHGLRVLGDRTGEKQLGKLDWYAVGSKYLLRTQKPDGSWAGKDGFDYWPPVSTSFALLFLAR